MENLLESRTIQFTGKLMFFSTIITAATNLIAQMEIFNQIVVVVSAFIGLPFAYYKLRVIHHDYVERKEKRKAEGKSPIVFRFRIKKSWKKKK